jgi:hypothetical protein
MFIVLDRARPYIAPTRACAHLPDRARSLRAMHRLLCVASRRALAWWRHDHPDRHARTVDDLVVRHACTRRLHPKSKICSLAFQPTPARALHCSNSRAHTRMFWARDDRGRKPPLHPLPCTIVGGVQPDRPLTMWDHVPRRPQPARHTHSHTTAVFLNVVRHQTSHRLYYVVLYRVSMYTTVSSRPRRGYRVQ